MIKNDQQTITKLEMFSMLLNTRYLVLKLLINPTELLELDIFLLYIEESNNFTKFF